MSEQRSRGPAETAPDPWTELVVQYDRRVAEAEAKHLKLMEPFMRGSFGCAGIVLAVILAVTVDPEHRLLAILGSLAFGLVAALIVPKAIRAESGKTVEVHIDRGVAFTMGTQGIRLPDPAGGARDLPWNMVRLHLTDSENPGDDPASIRLVAGGESRSYLSRALTPDVSTIREAEKRLQR